LLNEAARVGDTTLIKELKIKYSQYFKKFTPKEEIEEGFEHK